MLKAEQQWPQASFKIPARCVFIGCTLVGRGQCLDIGVQWGAFVSCGSKEEHWAACKVAPGLASD